MSSNANMYTVHQKKKKKKESNAFMKGEECVKEVILDTRVSKRWNEAAWVRSGGWFAKLCFWTGFSSPSPAQIKRGLIIQVYGFHISLCLSLILPDFTRSARLQIHPRPNHQTADPDI